MVFNILILNMMDYRNNYLNLKYILYLMNIQCFQPFQFIVPLDLIFIHIPKTGGSMIEKQLSIMNKNIYNNNQRFGGHNSIINFKKYLRLENISHFNKFGVVRNPYDKIISAYNYLKDCKDRQFISDIYEWNYLGAPETISEFITNIYNKYKYNDLLIIKDDQNIHIQQQYKFVVNNYDEKNILCEILKYEYLDEDFLKFIELYKDNKEVYEFLYNNIYENIKIKERYDVMSILTKDDIKKVNQIYNNDFLLFHYDKIDCEKIE